MTTKFIAGTYKALEKGFIHDKLRYEGDIVEISEGFLKAHPRFSASWLELVEPLKAVRKDSSKPVKSDESPVDSNI